MTTLTLYTTAGCHLCQLAETMLQTLSSQRDITINAVEIGDDDNLVERYGVSIPVIKFPNGSEIGWPFEAQDIESKLI